MNCINTFFSDLLNLLYPKICAGCGSDKLGKEQQICLQCLSSLPPTGFWNDEGNPVEKIFWGRIPVEAAASQFYFTKSSAIQQLMHQLKYRGNREVGKILGRITGEELVRAKRFRDIDLILPLPLNEKKEKKRGYNQAAVICDGIAEVLQVPVVTDAVRRKVNTATQTKKSRAERWDNIQGSFELMKIEELKQKHVLLVDDVITTGATLEACGKEILKAEQLSLSIASLAYTTL